MFSLWVATVLGLALADIHVYLAATGSSPEQATTEFAMVSQSQQAKSGITARL